MGGANSFVHVVFLVFEFREDRNRENEDDDEDDSVAATGCKVLPVSLLYLMATNAQ